MLTSKVYSLAPVCHCNWCHVIGGKYTSQVKCYNHNNIFFARFMSSQIRDDRSQWVFFTQMTSCAMRNDIIYHPFPISSQYLKTWGVDSTGFELVVSYLLAAKICR